MLTAAKIKALRPRATRYTVTDQRGLGLEVMPSGSKIWRYRSYDERLTIGRWPKMSLDAARKVRFSFEAAWSAGDTLRTVAAHIGVTGKKEAPTVQQFSLRYIKEVLERDRKSPKQLRRMIERQILPRIGSRLMCNVEGPEVRELIFEKRDQGKPAAAAALRNLIKRMWDYAIVCGAATVNPAHATPLKFIARKGSRNRTLSRKEVGRFVNTLYQANQLAWRHKQALHLILLTMVRKSELQLATWAEFDLDQQIWEIPSDHSKTGKPHIVYLSCQAMEILNRRATIVKERMMVLKLEECVFPAQESFLSPMSDSTLNRAMARVKWGMPHFTIHDLRRTAATLLSEEGFQPDVIEKALNHTIKGVRGVYNRAEYSEQRRQMLQAWADLIDKWRAGYAER